MIDCARVGPNVVWMGCPTPQVSLGGVRYFNESVYVLTSSILQVCVSECPTSYWTYLERFAEEQAEEVTGSSDPADRTGFICQYDVDPTSSEYAVRSQSF